MSTDDKPTVKPLRPCHACGRDHGSTNAERICLEKALAAAREALRRSVNRQDEKGGR